MEKLNKNTENSILYYGATNYAIGRINEYIKITGTPAAIIRDPRYDNYQENEVCDEIDIISFDKALELYPNAEIWMTYRNAGNVPNELAQKISPEKIHFFEANLEYRNGCISLGKVLNYSPDCFAPCCSGIKNVTVKTKGTFAERIVHWQKHTAQLIEDMRTGKQNTCTGCPRLKYGFYPKQPALESIHLTTDHPGDVCNFKCIYCVVQKNLEYYRKLDGITTYEILRQLSEIPEYNTPNLLISLSNGEICVNKYRNEIFDLLLKMNWKVSIITNMSMYNEKFAQLLQTGKVVNIVTSLDSGTRETFKKIKQADAFNKVVSNLKKYPTEKTNLQLKYIFLDGINDNETDVDEFYNLVKELNCKLFIISSDFYKPLTNKIKDLVLRLLEKAHKDGITVLQTYLTPEDQKFFNDNYTRIITNKKESAECTNIIGKNNEVIFIKDNIRCEMKDGSGLSIYIRGDNNKLTFILPSSVTNAKAIKEMLDSD